LVAAEQGVVERVAVVLVVAEKEAVEPAVADSEEVYHRWVYVQAVQDDLAAVLQAAGLDLVSFPMAVSSSSLYRKRVETCLLCSTFHLSAGVVV
jgi:hypothetical protein